MRKAIINSHEVTLNKHGHVDFTPEMRKTHTILIPNMAPIHFTLIKNVFINAGYKMELLTNSSRSVVDEGLKYVHNDTCYPALLVIGQFIDALNSGKYDVNRTALMITQTGGGCRASNYIHLLRKALVKAGYGFVPVISLNLSGLESSSGFRLTLAMIRKMVAAVVYGDMMMLLRNQVLPYEVNRGETDALVMRLTKQLSDQLARNRGYRLSEFAPNLDNIVREFAKIPVRRRNLTRVGIVGEIYVKYSSLGNNNLEEFLRSQDCEVMVPGIMGFLLFKVDNRLEDIRLYGGSRIKYAIVNALYRYLTKMERIMLDTLTPYSQFLAPSTYEHQKGLVSGVIGHGSKMGEGWLLTAEMLELVESGYPNIVCTQPFGCLPNHIVGKGMVRRIRQIDPRANIVPIDYDPGATRVNQENRIKLMLAVAREQNLVHDKPVAAAAEAAAEKIAAANHGAKSLSAESYAKASG
jgi:predicted nucleotide-binding protein (sugar kinase/HSP70/actin superfamily)